MTRRVLLTVNEAAERLTVDHKTIRRAIANGELPGYRIGSSSAIRVDQEDVDALLRPIPAVGA